MNFRVRPVLVALSLVSRAACSSGPSAPNDGEYAEQLTADRRRLKGSVEDVT